MILSFLDHLESERKCGARTRNLRLTAIRSFMRYVSLSNTFTRKILTLKDSEDSQSLLGLFDPIW
jgi:hypothetical protein